MTSKTRATKLAWDLGVEQVTHRVHEDQPRPPPSGRSLQLRGVDRDPEAWPAGPRIAVMLVLGLSHPLQASSQRQRIAVVTARGDAIATGDRIPGRLGPFDRAVVSHDAPAR